MPRKEDVNPNDNKEGKFGKDRRRNDKKDDRKWTKDKKPQGGKMCMNDPKWYTLSDGNVKDVFSLAFSNVVGYPLQVGPRGIEFTMPSVCGVYYTPVPGRCLHENDAFNLATRNLYTFVRHMNSGHTNYESVDLGIYLYAVGSLIGTMAHLERILSLTNTFSSVNRTFQLTVLSALTGITGTATVENYLDDMQTNAANYRARLGILLAKLASLAIPTGYAWIERLIWMNSNIFKDHESGKADLYAFVPLGTWQFDAVGVTTGGSLKFVEFANLTSFGGYLQVFTSAVNAILEDEDMAIMSGDIRKAFTDERLYKYAFLPENMTLVPVYVEEMLPQIHNLNTIPGIAKTGDAYGPGSAYVYRLKTDSSDYCAGLSAADYSAVMGTLRIVQVNGVLKSAYSVGGLAVGGYTAQSDPFAGVGFVKDSDWPKAPSSNSIELDYHPLNSYKADPTPEDVAIATRLKSDYRFVATTEGSNAVRAIQVWSHGTEIVNFLRICRYRSGDSYIGVATVCNVGFCPPNLSVINYSEAVLSALTKFDWFPIGYQIGVNLNGDLVPMNITGDFDNFTCVSASRLGTMHLSAVLAEFCPPELKFIK